MDSNKTKLSIIIPVYNTSAFLRKCLDSVVRATKGLEGKVEALIINDGSTDNSGDIIGEYCEKYSNIFKRFDKTNGGLSDVKNYGLARAMGEYVIFLDSDDYVEEDMYRDMLATAEKEDADVVVCDIKLVYDEPEKNTVWPCAIDSREDIFSKVIDMSMMPASWNKIVRKTLYTGLDFPVGINNEDVAVTPIILGRAKKIAVVAKPYYNYYQRAGSIQNSGFNEKRFVILDTSKICVDRVQEFDKEKQEKIKGSVYVHQVISLAFYPIRMEKFVKRYRLLRKYMPRVEELFPEIWDNFEMKELVTWENILMQTYRKISIALLRKKLYLLTSILWTVANMLFAGKQLIMRKRT